MWRRSPSTSAPSAPRFSPGSAPPTAKSASARTAPGRAPKPPGEGTNVGYLAGIDVGSRMTRGVLVDEHGRVQAKTGRETGARLEVAAQAVLDELCATQRIKQEEILYVASTGYGRYRVLFRQIQITEMTCHGGGARWLFTGKIGRAHV